ncbi:MAG: hypothetical protein M9933_01395 [Chitinophagaceae bacterium]|nr:hypothetical protein [Chitinophagaceae bacterium]
MERTHENSSHRRSKRPGAISEYAWPAFAGDEKGAVPVDVPTGTAPSGLQACFV